MEENKVRQDLLEVHDLSSSFKMYDNNLEQKYLKVISEMSLNVRRGEIIAIAGSSGSGKSLLAHALLGILPDNALVSGSMLYEGRELTPAYQKQLRGREMALIPQSVAYLDPLMQIWEQVRGVRGTAAAQKEAFRRYELSEKVERLYPFQLSGGMARRALVATAIVNDAELIVADEPTPGLDLKFAMLALQQFRELADQGKGVILITHDIDLAFNIADRIAVFYAGTTVEIAAAAAFKGSGEQLRHPYTRALFRALPQNEFEPIPGGQPYPGKLPDGCLFGPRCPHCTESCLKKIPMRKDEHGWVRCIKYGS